MRTPERVHVEGDPDHPINQGTLCPKGITLKQNIVNDRRLTTVRYRAPGSAVWEDKSWDWAIDRLAREGRDDAVDLFLRQFRKHRQRNDAPRAAFGSRKRTGTEVQLGIRGLQVERRWIVDPGLDAELA